ncbi:hypothetical protein B0H14DRAFT_2372824, partial [Mycena olivaceomarginata]
PTQPICWLHGPAGAGKSAVIQTMCKRLQSMSRLGGAFFFKRGHATRGNSRALFMMLAYQLALNNNHELNPLISQTVEHDPSIVGRSIDTQLHQLIIEPCKSLKDSAAPILLVDGLDECDTHDAQVEVLHLIGCVICQHPNIFRMIIASRPEPHICDSLEEPSFGGILHSVNIEQSFDDVRIFPHPLQTQAYNGGCSDTVAVSRNSGKAGLQVLRIFHVRIHCGQVCRRQIFLSN